MTPFPITAEPPRRVLWPPVVALAGVQGAIALLWIVYNLYLGQLLSEAGLPASLATTLLLIENGIAAVIEPFAGRLSDRLQTGLGSRLPLILLGTLLSAACFLLIPGLALGGQNFVHALLPACIILWALAMTLFRSPALALLGRYATPSQLPQAAVLLTLMGGLTGAIKPLSGDWIVSWGPQVAFLVGSLTLLLAVGVFWTVQPSLASSLAIAPESATADPTPPSTWNQTQRSPLGPRLACIFGTGAGVTLGFRLLMANWPKLLAVEVPELNGRLIGGLVSVVIAIAALTAATWAKRFGNRWVMGVSCGLMGLLCGLVNWAQTAGLAIGFAIAIGVVFSVVANGTLPFALRLVSEDRQGLATGMYFSGVAAAAVVMSWITPLASGVALGLGFAAFLGAGLCVALSLVFVPRGVKTPYKTLGDWAG